MLDTGSESLSSNIDRSSLPQLPMMAMRKKKQLTAKNDLFTTDHVQRHINIGDSLLTYLYKDLEILLDNATCTHKSDHYDNDFSIFNHFRKLNHLSLNHLPLLLCYL